MTKQIIEIDYEYETTERDFSDALRIVCVLALSFGLFVGSIACGIVYILS